MRVLATSRGLVKMTAPQAAIPPITNSMMLFLTYNWWFCWSCDLFNLHAIPSAQLAIDLYVYKKKTSWFTSVGLRGSQLIAIPYTWYTVYVLVSLIFYFNPYPAKLIYLNFHPLEVVARYRDPQLQVVENELYLFNLSTDIFKSWCLKTHFIPNNGDFVD